VKKIIHFSNGGPGGVQAVIRNLLQYSRDGDMEHHIIYTINEERKKDFAPRSYPQATSVQIFYYQSTWNFFYTCKQLSALVPDETSILVAHDWLELGMISTLGLKNPVVQILHGDYDYYYQLAVLHHASINKFIGVSKTIEATLKKRLPSREKDINALYLPVAELSPIHKERKGNKILFIGRYVPGKGSLHLPQIAALLKDEVHFQWHIYGPGSLEKENQALWDSGVDVSFYGWTPSEDIIKVLPQYDYFVLPSIAEGMPVAVIEAMKAGVIPIVNHLGGGVEELLGSQQERGYLIKDNNVEGYAAVLLQLNRQPDLRNSMAAAASQYACQWFHPETATQAFEAVFKQAATHNNSHRQPQKVYGSRLDKAWIPNWVTYFIRKYLS